VAVVPEEGGFKLVVLSADEGKDESEGENGDAEEDPEKSGDFVGSIMNPVDNLGSAVVGRRSILDVGEGSEDGGDILAIASAFPVNFDSLEDVEGEFEFVRVVGVLEASLDGLVGSWALGESIHKGLSWEGGVSDHANVGLMSPEISIGRAGASRGANNLICSGVDQVNFLQITGGVVALPSESISSVTFNLGSFNSDSDEKTS